MIKGIKNKDIKDFEKTISKLNEVMDRISKYCPNALVFFTPNQANLMCDSLDLNESEENVVISCDLKHMDCGDW